MLNKNDRVIIKATEETGTITNIFDVKGVKYYELEDSDKAYTREELLLYQVAEEEQRQTFEDTASIPVPLDINTPIVTPADEEPTITISVKDYEAYNKDKDVLDTIKELLNK